MTSSPSQIEATPTPEYSFVADRPFVYIITSPSAIVFMGRYTGEQYDVNGSA